MTTLNADQKKYGFIVAYDANKIEIKKAITKKFNVNVVDVNTIRYDGKTKTQFRKGGRFSGKTPHFKKAVVTLKTGDTIDLFEQV